MAKKREAQVAEAVGAAGAQSNDTPSSRDIEAAMAQAAEQAQTEGVSDPDEIRSRMLEARKRVTQANG
jgi:hypothetical protein